MKIQRMVLLIGGMSGVALAAALAQAPNVQPMIVSDLTGTLRIEQPIPCTDDVDQTTPVTGGRIEMSPAEGVDVAGGAKTFVLNRVSVSFAPFSIHRSCLTVDRTRNYTEVGVQLARAVTFTAAPLGAGLFQVTIPAEDFLIYESAVVDGEAETGYKRPKEPVTATIDLAHGTVQLHVAIGTRVKFKAGCIDPCPIGSCEVCVVDETTDGTLTADLAGTIHFPDSDADGVPDRNDNCRFVPNPTQTPVPTSVVTPPAAATINSCQSRDFGVATASDVCDASFVSLTNDAPGTFNLGPNVVTWTGVDGHGRVGSATQNVTVVDTTKPVFTFVPGPIALNDCKAANLGLPTATDDCAGTPTFTNNAPPKFPVGPTVVTWTAKDASRNMSTATQTVTVTDTVAPAPKCQPTEKPKGKDDDDDDHHGDRDDHRGGDDDFDKGYFKVTSTDACTASPGIKLGTFNLGNGEVINIKQTKKPGIRLVHDADSKHVRHFEVGPGQNLIASTDGSGNAATASCVDPHDHDRVRH